MSTQRIFFYKQLFEYLRDYYKEYLRTEESGVLHKCCMFLTYTKYQELTLSQMILMQESLKELDDFVVAHKSVVEMKAYIIFSSKTKL